MPNHFLRLVYVAEFLLAIVAVLSLWSQVGGQGHLDLMPWYLKLALTGCMALVVVTGTAAALSHEDAWNAKTIAFLILGILIACAMGAVTYYYHLHENDEDNDDTTPAVAGFAEGPSACNRGLGLGTVRVVAGSGGLKSPLRAEAYSTL